MTDTPAARAVPALSDEAFLGHVADRLAALPAVSAVTLGGSRAQGLHTAGSDWDLAVYYRGPFDPARLRALGWEGEVGELGAWGGGVFNGGAWLTIDGRHVDVHYRDLDVPRYPEALREAAPPVWRQQAAMTLRYAKGAHAPRGQLTEVAGALATAAAQTAHAVLAERGEWVTNEKRLLTRAELRGLDPLIASLSPDPAALRDAVSRAAALLGLPE